VCQIVYYDFAKVFVNAISPEDFIKVPRHCCYPYHYVADSCKVLSMVFAVHLKLLKLKKLAYRAARCIEIVNFRSQIFKLMAISEKQDSLHVPLTTPGYHSFWVSNRTTPRRLRISSLFLSLCLPALSCTLSFSLAGPFPLCTQQNVGRNGSSTDIEFSILECGIFVSPLHLSRCSWYACNPFFI